MTRKDTIIIAVLINAGLLIVLFASALKSSGPNHEVAAAIPQKMIAEPIAKKEVLHNGGDEVDQALQKFASTSTSQEKKTEYSAPMATTAPSVSFSDDLKAFSAPETAVAAVFSPPAANASAEDKKTGDYTEIKVKKGDVLEKIARQHHTSIDAIIACNQLSSTNLRIGQTLKIPNKKASPVVQNVASASTSGASDGHKYYTVKTGDNPWTIAVKNHMKVEELLKINNLDQDKARKLKPGDKLLIQ